MLATKLHVAFFLCALIFSSKFTNSVDGVPTRKPPVNGTRLRAAPPAKRPTARSGRFLGKFSVLAGLGLPEPTPTPPVSRSDYLYEQRAPPAGAQLAASYNFPPTRWGPYVAAVYEPVPLGSFLQNPLGYLASVLNPYNWLANTESAPGVPAATAAPPPERRPEEVVVVVREPGDEVGSDERRTTAAAFDADETLERENMIDDKSDDPVKSTTSKSIRKMKLRPTIDLEKIMDLIAEEATMKLVRSDDDPQDDDSRQAHKPAPSTKSTVPQPHVTKPTPKITTSKSMTTVKSTSVHEVTEPSHHPTVATSASTSAQTSTATPATSSPYPNPSYGPPNYVNGYYYGGYPQNVSHIELTTPAEAESFAHAAPISFQSFNDLDEAPQRLADNRYDAFGPQPHAAFDYYSHFGQLQRVDDQYQKNERTLAGSRNSFGPTGFRPSYPVYQ